MATPQQKYPRMFYDLFNRVLDEGAVELTFGSPLKAERYRRRLYAFRQHVLLKSAEGADSDPVLAAFIQTVSLNINGTKLILQAKSRTAQKVWKDVNREQSQPSRSNHD